MVEVGSVLGIIFWIALGAGCIGLGVKAFTAAGVPLTKSTNLSGSWAKAIGLACFLLGALLIAIAVFRIIAMLRLLLNGLA